MGKWLQEMERLGQADIPMEFNGEILTPRQYVQKYGDR